MDKKPRAGIVMRVCLAMALILVAAALAAFAMSAAKTTSKETLAGQGKSFKVEPPSAQTTVVPTQSPTAAPSTEGLDMAVQFWRYKSEDGIGHVVQGIKEVPEKYRKSAEPYGERKMAASASEVKLEECRSKLKKARELDLLYNLDVQGPRILVAVGPTFYTIPFDAKQGFASTINCFLVAGEPKVVNFELRDWQTNKVVAAYEYGRLEMK